MNFTIFSHAMFSCIGSHRRLLRFLGVTEPLLELEFERRLLEFERRLVEKVKQFLLELGLGFTYIGNQHVLSYNGKDYKVDMLFFHRGLRLLVTVDLEISEFMPEYISKMNLCDETDLSNLRIDLSFREMQNCHKRYISFTFGMNGLLPSIPLISF